MTNRPAPTALRLLTAREREVLALTATGLSSQEMAAQLYITLDTLKTHLRRASRALGARSRTDAVVRALQTRQIEWPPLPSNVIAPSDPSAVSPPNTKPATGSPSPTTSSLADQADTLARSIRYHPPGV